MSKPSAHAVTSAYIDVTLLQTLFIGLKLTGYLTWGWFWVLSPVWVPLTILVSLTLLYFVLYELVRK